MNSIEIITTADGSHTLLNKELNETYHSVHGAVQESQYVFIDKGLAFWLEKNKKPAVKIFEVGFGTGLNALLTLRYKTHVTIEYTSLETRPLEKSIWTDLNYTAAEEKDIFYQIHGSEWNQSTHIKSNFILHKVKNSLQDVNLLNQNFDLVFFDAFAPSRQPELWSLPMLEKIYYSMTYNGVFVTYCAKGQLKRDLKSLGFMIETLPGAPGKKEMVRAIKN